VTNLPSGSPDGDPGGDPGAQVDPSEEAKAAARAADPVRQRRARIARLVSLGQRIGYSLFAVAVVAFGVGFAAGFTTPVVVIIEICLLIGSLLLAPAIVFGYAVKAADRDDREHGR
jgi:hypothetical protein